MFEATGIKPLKGKSIVEGTTGYEIIKRDRVNTHVFTTKDIKINRKNLGKYKIIINKYGVTIKHETYNGGWHYHPHVGTLGSPCFGDYRRILTRAGGDLRKIVEIVIEFLSNYTRNNAYETLSVVYKNLKE